MLTKRRSPPLSSSSRSRMPGWRCSRSSITARTESPPAATSPTPAVNLRSGVGTLTLIAIAFRINLPGLSPDRAGCSRLIEGRAGGSSGCAGHRALAVRKPLIERVEFLEARFDNHRLLDDAG